MSIILPKNCLFDKGFCEFFLIILLRFVYTIACFGGFFVDKSCVCDFIKKIAIIVGNFIKHKKTEENYELCTS